MQPLHFLVFIFTTTVAASNSSCFDDGNFDQSCDHKTFKFTPHLGLSAVCRRADGKSNFTTTLGLSKCIAYNTKTGRVEWKIPPSCTNSTTADEKKMDSTQGNLSVLAS
ncbi:hypothetical protein NEUTE1DRAFT_45909 [Neurospora tetrasperma FGSC 2508]|uniref:Cyanovirin-N domain-containing protein n=1 Tax=Neurospora tetrasperma (strain FGSC 2508 / ATCC MYA-4615 / P0657) TaxID=510951 RepID=F8MNS7_NEUT8|nr:uncharacterized protein NEUTE1DRAFT_45909 [Neurospora tetrasperma FGSC 2508]EGO56199.1 hypothetical protein NEUTE1DRAFT_45909 [Neurospora tetrasperma FGSC 2508]EGZ70946.1 hypothetical protein NEUTE2DRAFT_67020 [Neurospora tetrasperma FGSC 2509]